MRKFIALLSFILIGSTVCAQNKSYTFVFLNNKPDKEVLSKEKADSIMQGHMNNIGRLAKEGKLLAAGPFEGGGGIFILNTTSVDEANQWLATDPGIKARRWNVEVLPYTVSTGSICPVGEDYKMVFYQFIRFTPETEGVKWGNESLKKLKIENSLIHAGIFGNSQGGIIVIQAEGIVDLTSAVKDIQVKVETKKLYIAKGSFCEK